mmetsp:Transcript_95948/g.169607  ORF Transcript_95948/g.169607 Transcript_95948/m.169607 type:complete len:304 (-) Transcript_95948:19-930(-)
MALRISISILLSHFRVFAEQGICEGDASGHLNMLQAKSNRIRSEVQSEVPYAGPKVVGVGWKKSGTSSLGWACHVLKIPRSPEYACKDSGCMQTLSCIEDAPTCCDHGLISALKRDAPSNVKFVLQERDPEDWRRSIDHWMQVKPHLKCWYGEVMQASYGSEEFYRGYARHNEWVKQLFSDEPERLLVLNMSDVVRRPVEHMQKFCSFLGINHPNCSMGFPHTNTPGKAQDYRDRLVQNRAGRQRKEKVAEKGEGVALLAKTNNSEQKREGSYYRVSAAFRGEVPSFSCDHPGGTRSHFLPVK